MGLLAFFQKKDKIRFRQLITLTNPKSPISEQYRTIRTSINYSNFDRENRLIMITSSAPAEGKTTTAANLAVVFAQQGKKVLLMDADFRKPRIHEVFRRRNYKGLTSILYKKMPLLEAIHETRVKNLSILTSGPIAPNPSELLSSKSMKDLLENMRSQFDIIIMDTPPILPVTDAQILASQCDGVILIISSGKTKKIQAEKAKTLLVNAKAKILGVVLNHSKENYQEYYNDYYG